MWSDFAEKKNTHTIFLPGTLFLAFFFFFFFDGQFHKITGLGRTFACILSQLLTVQKHLGEKRWEEITFWRSFTGQAVGSDASFALYSLIFVNLCCPRVEDTYIEAWRTRPQAWPVAQREPTFCLCKQRSLGKQPCVSIPLCINYDCFRAPMAELRGCHQDHPPRPSGSQSLKYLLSGPYRKGVLTTGFDELRWTQWSPTTMHIVKTLFSLQILSFV